MNLAHLHLAVNHVSLFCLLIGVAALIASMKRKSGDLRGLASVLFIVGGVFVVITMQTGEGAEDVVKALKLGGGVEQLIENHEQAAIWARRSGILVAVLAIAMEWAVRKKKKFANKVRWALLIFAIHGCTVFAATALQGGLIRHTEIRSEAAAK